MKISKKLLSLVLCVAMLLSTTAFASMTSAPQEDAKSLAWFTEDITPGTKVMARRGVSGTDSTETYKTIAEMTEVLKDGSSDDYALNFKVSTTSSTKNNYAALRKSGSSTSYFPVSNGLFSLSYDICFKSATKGGVALSFSGQNINSAGENKGGSNPWGIGRSVFIGLEDETKIALWDQGASTQLNMNEWYSVKHFFNTKTGYEYMTATDSTGKVYTVSPQALNTALINAAGVYMIDIASKSACEFSIDNITIKDESVFLESNDDSFLAAENVTLTATIPEGFENAVVMADGDVAGQITPVSGKNVYDITIPASELGLGNHELILSASYDDMTRTDTINVTVSEEYEKAVSGTINHPTTVEEFDHLFTNVTNTSASVYNSVYPNGTYWQPNGDTFLVAGPSGEENDYGIYINAKGKLLQIRGLSNPPASSGKIIVEFDMMLGAGTSIWSENLSGSSYSTNFINNNKIFGIIDIAANSWTHVKLVCDVTDGSLVAIANNQTAECSSALNLTKGYIRFTLCTNTMFAIDNTRIYNLVTAPVINSATYVTANGETATTGAIPANATALKLTMSEALTVTADDVELYADNEPITASNVESADGVVTITLPTLSANKDLKVVLKNSIDGLGSALTQNLYVTDVSGNFFKNSGVVTANGEKTAVIRHMGSGTSKAIAAAYSGNELVAIKVYDFKSVSGIGAVNVSVPVANADSVKFMAWNTLSSATPKITSPLYNVD